MTQLGSDFGFFRENSKGWVDGGELNSCPSTMMESVLSNPAETASLLATTVRCIDSGMLPHSEGVPTGVLVATKRKLISNLLGASPGGLSGDIVAASEAYESAVRLNCFFLYGAAEIPCVFVLLRQLPPPSSRFFFTPFLHHPYTAGVSALLCAAERGRPIAVLPSLAPPG